MALEKVVGVRVQMEGLAQMLSGTAAAGASVRRMGSEIDAASKQAGAGLTGAGRAAQLSSKDINDAMGRAGASIAGFGQRVRDDSGHILGAFDKTKLAVAGLADETMKASLKHEQAFKTVGMGAAGFGAALLGGFGLAANAAANFQKEMSGVSAVSNATEAEMRQLSQAALDAGQATSFSASEAAKAQAELAKAGISTADILGGALRGALDLAAAGQLELADAATITAQAMNVFKLEGKDVGHIADVLAAGANKSAADVKQLGDALRQGGLVAAQTGLSLEETVGTLAAFADRALIGSDAGTSLKTMLQRLTPSSAEAADQMRELGFSAWDAQGNFIGMAGLARELQDSLGPLDQKSRNAALGIMFGSDAIRGANVAMELGEQGIRDYILAVNDQGAAARMAAEQLNNLKGDLEVLAGSVETVMIKMGESSQGPLRMMVQGVTGVVDTLGGLPPSVFAGVSAIGTLTGVTALAGGAALVAVPKIAQFGTAWGELAAAAPRLTGALSGVTGFLIGPWGLALAGAVAAVTMFMEARAEFAASADEFTAALKQDSGELGNNTRQLIANNLEKEGALQLAEKLGVAHGDMTRALMGEKDAQERVREATENQVGVWDELVSRFIHGEDVGTRLGRVLDEQGRIMDASTEATRRKADEEKAAAAASEKLTAEQEFLAAGGHNVAAAMDSQRKSMEELAPAHESVVEASEKVSQAVEDMGKAFTDMGSPIKVYTELLAEKGAAEEEAAKKLAESTADQSDSWKDFVGEANVTLTEYTENLKQRAEEMRAFQENLVIVAQKAGLDVAVSMAKMGDDGVHLAHIFATGTTAEVEAATKAWHDLVAVSGQNVAQEMENANKIQLAIAASGGKATVQALAAQLQLGVGEVASIAAKYGIALASGLNPVLASLGQKLIATGRTDTGDITKLAKARGGIDAPHIAQIANAGAWRIWAEPETGGEAYIPLAPGKRSRSLDIWRETGKRLGVDHFATGGFASVQAVPRPPVPMPYAGIANSGNAGAQHAYDTTVKWLEANLAPKLAGGPGQWRAMFDWISSQHPGIRLISGFRPGATTLSGSRSYHSMGRAIDISPSMAAFLTIGKHYAATELIYTPGGRLQEHHGRPHIYSSGIAAQHYDHVHWAQADGGVLTFDRGGLLPPGYSVAYNGTGRSEAVIPYAGGGLTFGEAPNVIRPLAPFGYGKPEVTLPWASPVLGPRPSLGRGSGLIGGLIGGLVAPMLRGLMTPAPVAPAAPVIPAPNVNVNVAVQERMIREWFRVEVRQALTAHSRAERMLREVL